MFRGYPLGATPYVINTLLLLLSFIIIISSSSSSVMFKGNPICKPKHTLTKSCRGLCRLILRIMHYAIV